MLRKLSERLAGSTKSVTSGELPHAGKELGETTAEKSHADDDVGGFDATGMDIEQRQNKRRRSKGEETTVTTHSGSALVRRTVTKKRRRHTVAQGCQAWYVWERWGDGHRKPQHQTFWKTFFGGVFCKERREVGKSDRS